MKQYLKNKNIMIFFIIILILALTLTISYVFTGNVIIKTSTNILSYSVDEDINFTYNIKINNTNLLSESNITKVNISLPSSFSFLLGSNGTDSLPSSFLKVGNDLIWSNDGLIMNLSTQSFWFDSYESSPGNYNLTVTTTNSTGSYSFNISIIINDLTPPSEIKFVSPTENNNKNISKTNILVNITSSDNGNIDTVVVRLFNSSNKQVSINSSKSSSLFINFTGLSSGIYYFNSTVNDTYGNINNTSTRKINIDTSSPNITLISPSDLTSSSINSYDFIFTVVDTHSIKNCTLFFNNAEKKVLANINDSGVENLIHVSGLSIDKYTWNISCVNNFLNTANSLSRELIVKNSTLVSTNKTISTTQVLNTQIMSESNNIPNNISMIVNEGNSNSSTSKDLSGGYGKIMNKNSNLTFKIENESHSLNIKNISEKSVKIILSSTPQEATFLLGEEKKFDLSEDGYYDLSVKLNFIYYINESEPKANFTIKTIHEKIKVANPATNKIKNSNKEKDGGLIILIIFASIILILILFGLIHKIYIKIKKIKHKKHTKRSKK